MTTPNIFTFATGELSQDAAFAYLLQWADPQYKLANAKMHVLGTDFLRAILLSINEQTEKIEKGDKVTVPDKFNSVCIETQTNRIDVSVKINDEIFLIIEDKTNTGPHSEQIKRYKSIAAELKNSKDEPWRQVVAVYMKTGNECHDAASVHADGVMYRPAILQVLHRHPDTGDAIAKQFRQHLQDWEDRTNAWKTWTRNDGAMPWDAIQGYFMALEDAPGVSIADWGWGYTSNPSGGFLEYATKKKCAAKSNDKHCLQIRSGVDLYLRMLSPCDTKRLWEFLGTAQKLAEKFPGMQIEKPARLAGGKNSAAFAKVYFGGTDSYLALDGDGKIDFNKTVQHLQSADQLLGELAEKF